MILDSVQLKATLKEAIVELLQEHRDEFGELLLEAIADLAMERAIEEGESSELVSREEIFNLLDSKQ